MLGPGPMSRRSGTCIDWRCAVGHGGRHTVGLNHVHQRRSCTHSMHVSNGSGQRDRSAQPANTHHHLAAERCLVGAADGRAVLAWSPGYRGLHLCCGAQRPQACLPLGKQPLSDSPSGHGAAWISRSATGCNPSKCTSAQWQPNLRASLHVLAAAPPCCRPEDEICGRLHAALHV